LDGRELCMDEWTIKTPNPICRLFFKIYLLTELAALCLTDFIDWRYIHSLVGTFDPACELLPPLDEGTILVYCCPSIFSLTCPPPSQTKCTVYRQCVSGGRVNCAVDHILQEFYTDQIQNLPNCFTIPNKMTSEDDIKGLVSLKFLRPWNCVCVAGMETVKLCLFPPLFRFKYIKEL
jgi:hypothetical protein